jgi:hypothetical protein
MMMFSTKVGMNSSAEYKCEEWIVFSTEGEGKLTDYVSAI